MHTLFKPFIFLLLLMMSQSSYATSTKESPEVLLKRITQELTSELRRDNVKSSTNSAQLYKVIDRILVPHVDWEAMSQWVLGRDAWLKATTLQRQEFSEEFKDLLIRTYASTLKAYNNQTIEYLPIRGGMEGKSRVQIASYIREPGREPIKVSYRLANKGQDWKVYDITIEGISLLKGFQSQFAPEVRQGGVTGITKRLHQHNEKPLR